MSSTRRDLQKMHQVIVSQCRIKDVGIPKSGSLKITRQGLLSTGGTDWQNQVIIGLIMIQLLVGGICLIGIIISIPMASPVRFCAGIPQNQKNGMNGMNR